MANENETNQAEAGTNQPTPNRNTGFWDSIGTQDIMLPFFGPGEDLKRQGFRVRFLTAGPRKETPSRFNEDTTECWFDIVHYPRPDKEEDQSLEAAEPKKMTWTISQISLLSELKKHAPLTDKTFDIRLVKVEDDWRRDHPKFKGNSRYEVTYVETEKTPDKNPNPASQTSRPIEPDIEVEEI